MTIDFNPDPDPDPKTDLRPSPIAGLWYSGQSNQLSKEIDDYIARAHLPEWTGDVCGVIAPHAGYRYSGQTAGYAFRSVKGLHYDLVAVISPLHAYHPAQILTSSHTAYETPLGPVEIDNEAVDELDQYLRKAAGFGLTKVSRDNEHSLEIELPFLQRALAGSFKLLPIMIRSQDTKIVQQLGKGLAQVLHSRSALLVASTDLSHFYSEDAARNYDTEMLQKIEDFSPEDVLEAERNGTGFACGAAAVAAVLWAAQELGGDKVKTLHYSTSADETGDRHSVVGYGAAVILKPA
jgi:AmmeMemoRadiSam system protein B